MDEFEKALFEKEPGTEGFCGAFHRGARWAREWLQEHRVVLNLEYGSEAMQLKQLRTENAKLRGALEKSLWCMAYTNGDNGSKDWSEHDSRVCDCRAIAKQALASDGE